MHLHLHRLRGEISGASIPRAAALLAGVFVLELLFIASYAGALHEPKPHGIPVAFVGPAVLVPRLEEATHGALSLRVYPSLAAARQGILEGKVDAAVQGFVSGTQPDTLIVGIAPSPFVAQTVQEVVGRLEAAQHRRLTVEEIHPLPAEDSRGVVPFYLALSWVIGGYLAAIVLALSRGYLAASHRLAYARVAGLVGFSVASGVLGAVLAGPVMGLLPGDLARTMGIGTLVTLASAGATLGLQSVLGFVGTGLAIAAFVVFANPASGGPLPKVLLPEPWRSVGPYLPTGAGTDALRDVFYFGGHGVLVPLLLLAGYAVAGCALVAALGAAAARRAAA